MIDRLESIRRTLEAHGQAHVLAFFDELDRSQQEELLDQIEQIDFEALDELIAEYVLRKPRIELPGDLEPAPDYPFDSSDPARPYDAKKFRGKGEELIRGGKVAAFTVAGGQGTRLGWDGPKGTYPATVVTGKPLFRVFAEQIVATQRRYGGTIPWYIMTSPINDAATRAFFADNNYFGLVRRNIFMFPQGVLPSIESGTGKLLLEHKHQIAMNPDGHGGSIKALSVSGAIEDMVGRGIKHISYFQVDNPLVRAVDPLFLGLHAEARDSSAEISSKMVAKAHAEEKVGVFCRAGKKTMVIEYSDLPPELARQTDERGRLRFGAGNIAVHAIGVKFVQKLTANVHHFGLPYHRAEKKVPYIDVRTGKRVEPQEPNAVKLEAFVFDAIPLADGPIIYETSRVEEFAPIKNAKGADSPATSHQIQSDRNGGWLARNGVTVPSDGDGHVAAMIEISPLTALEAEDLVKVELPKVIAPKQEVVL
ncbi:MAG: UDPGP type 1 family protein [Phycisphaerales bacterium]|nr:UDPGP type 1 family protein [Phycisphaerales bacterium]MCI0630384.1 UDPGP type 1 family protein [Phycisphaerales bacterium]MCI0676019.1 UDPGP type 1 family protein [Phycisphaerales bacterium]